jgi:flagellar basal-body rod protein FlgB
MGLFDRTFGILARSLDLRASGHKVISSNIANAETPDYRSKNIPFQRILERSIGHSPNIILTRTHPDHLLGGFETAVEMESSPEVVNIDQEMAKLAENNLMFQAGVQVLVKKLEALKVTIIEGGK